MATDQVDVTLGNFIFDENNEERKSWKFFGHNFSRTATNSFCVPVSNNFNFGHLCRNKDSSS